MDALEQCKDFIVMHASQEADTLSEILCLLGCNRITVRTETYGDYDIVYRGIERIIVLLKGKVVLCLTKDAIRLLELDLPDPSDLLSHLNICPDEYDIIEGPIVAV